MALIAKSSVSLRFFGDDLRPDDLTSALGKPPDRATTTGESRTSGHVARTGSWLYGVESRQPGDLDGQIRELFGALTPDLSVWRVLSARYKPDLFVGLFLEQPNEGIEISAECLGILSSRGVSLCLDVYAP